MWQVTDSQEFNFNDVQDYTSPSIRSVIIKEPFLISQVEVAVKSYWSNIGKHLPKPEIADMGAVFGGVEVIPVRTQRSRSSWDWKKSSPIC